MSKPTISGVAPVDVPNTDQSKSQATCDDLISRIRKVVGGSDFVALHEPNMGDREQEYVADCVASGWVSSVGAYVDRFEQQVAQFTGAKHAIATVNGTAALHIGLLLAGVEQEDEVLCPALSFVATSNAISYCGAIPHFVDVERRTLGLDAARLGNYLSEISHSNGGQIQNRLTGRRISAIVPMHTLGHSVDLEPLQEVAKKFGLPIVEDAAESLGTYFQGKHTGTFGLAGALSFNGNKIMTTGGGGMILTNDTELATKAKHLTTTAKRPHRWRYFHEQTGFNYRMPNLNAALGCAQLERLDEFLTKKRAVADEYRNQFVNCENATFVDQWEKEIANYWLNAIILDAADSVDDTVTNRDRVLDSTNDAGLMTRPLWELLSDLPMNVDSPMMDLSVSKDLVQRTVCLPSSVCLG